MRVYWSGAAMMLMADTRLRAASGGRQSLDSALQSLQHCCLENGKSWRARDLLAELDRVTGTQIFSGDPDVEKFIQSAIGAELWPDPDPPKKKKKGR